MQKLLAFIMVALVLVSCTSSKPTVITSKKVAIQKKQYSTYTPQNKPSSTEVAIKEPPRRKVKSAPVNQESHPNSEHKIKNTPGIVNQNEDDIIIAHEEDPYFSEQLVNNALAFIGSPYRSGGTSRDGFDCSGLMFTTFETFEIILPRSSHEMAKIGREVNRDEIRRGDLIFFRTNGSRTINHVGMVTEVAENEIKFVHSSTQQGVVISSTKEPYYQRTFAQVNRVIE